MSENKDFADARGELLTIGDLVVFCMNANGYGASYLSYGVLISFEGNNAVIKNNASNRKVRRYHNEIYKIGV